MNHKQAPAAVILAALLALGLTAGLSGCAQQQSTRPQPIPKKETPESIDPAQPDGEQIAAKQLADQSDRREPTQAPRSNRPYPVLKSGFNFGPGRDWPRQQFDPNTPGPLLAVTEAQTAIEAEIAQAGICATAQAAAPLDAGPRQSWAGKKAQQLVGGVLGSLFGRGGDDSEPDAPDTEDNPLPANAGQLFSDAAGELELELAGQLTDQGMLINTAIKDAPGKPTFHTIYLERRDCSRAWPDRYLVYKIWLEWSLSVSWSRTESSYRNGDLVSERKSSGGFNRAGTVDLDQGRINLNRPENLSDYQKGILADAPPPIWKALGFNGPEAGVRSLGSQFTNVSRNALDQEMVAIVHVARPQGERYTTEAMAFRMEQGADGLLKFTRL
ncbi:hypothetical protein [Marinobacterium jannaschii]|uniref:hypothetical protein n=1 Tax=Marinobacterium jannaschii TaxID=64970 RepID=UPI000481E933|nr:hypothetical protein [Marinobacterium jannaschii]